ncbi:MAG: DUF4382 domain-containing protein [Cyclobacteriaceae bacterium]|nr:DUF4382 domain-containing protein [Cyclobacteriaceae bacterium]
MKMNRNFLLPALLTFLMFAGCTDDDQTARLRITLVDDPGDYDAVNVDIQGVSVHTNENAGENDNGWVLLENSNVGVKNLLDYTGGVELTLADTDFPAGRISQIRLLLGDNNSVTIDGNTEPLETPSAQQSGLKLQVHEFLKGGIAYEFKLDFEAARSVVTTGAGTKILKPVIKVFTKAVSGSITGSVLPAEENVAVSVMDGSDIIATTYAPAGMSDFLFANVQEGIYTVTFDPGELSDYASVAVENVGVMIGEVTNLGEIDLVLKE